MRSRTISIVAILTLTLMHGASAIRYDWNTDGNFEGWAGWNHTANQSVSGGTLNFDMTNWDPYVTSPALNISGSDNPWLKFGITYTPSNGQNSEFQLYFQNNTSGFSETTMVNFGRVK